MGSETLSALAEEYGIRDHVDFVSGPGGLPQLNLVHACGQVRIALQGAQVLSWVPSGHPDLIWMSPAARFAPGQPLRGGIPVCWPWFGSRMDSATLPAHGIARTALWDLVASEVSDDGRVRVEFRLIPGGAAASLWPFTTPVDYRVTLGEVLELELLTRNLSAETVAIGAALHTYWAVADVREVGIVGLDGCTYLDKVEGDGLKRQQGAVSITGETDRVYFDDGASCVIEDPGNARRIRVDKRGSRTTVVWNPWVEKAARLGDMGENGYLKMVCVETANAANDVVAIAPGGEHLLQVRYQVEAL